MWRCRYRESALTSCWQGGSFSFFINKGDNPHETQISGLHIFVCCPGRPFCKFTDGKDHKNRRSIYGLARALTRSLQSSLGNAVIVENKPGAGGNIAMDYVAAAPADGNTLVLATNNLTINPVLYQTVKFSAEKSFSPVSLMAESPVLFVTKVGSPLKDMKDVVAFAKANPGKLSYASCGNGNIHHFAGELFKSMAKASIVHIPYKGCSSAVTDVVSGQVDLGVISLTAVGPFISSNRVKALAVTSGQRSKLLPDIPTVAEATGLSNYALIGWYAMQPLKEH